MSTSVEPRILIVDDEASVRTLVGEYLGEAGYGVALAGSGAEALKALAHQPFDLVLSDARMPGMSGFELLVEIIAQHPRVGVLILTACEDLTLAVHAMRLGALDYILKPVRLPEIAASVAGALKRKQNMRQQEIRLQLLEQTVNERTLELRRLLDRLRDVSENVLEALVAALDAREQETHAHSKRVSESTLFLAREMEIDSRMLDVIRRGAMLHDIGKIGISDAILLKPGKLTEGEWVEMQKHPRIGSWILEGIEPLRPATDIVLSHHEKFDGSGYPRKLKGNEIPIGARIFTVMDSFDVMTSDRPYRKAMSYSAGRLEIARNSGSQFDPDVVRSFLRVPPEIWSEIRDHAGKSARSFRAARAGLSA
jgi:cyclic di-GMP phosphodiesterase